MTVCFGDSILSTGYSYSCSQLRMKSLFIVNLAGFFFNKSIFYCMFVTRNLLCYVYVSPKRRYDSICLQTQGKVTVSCDLSITVVFQVLNFFHLVLLNQTSFSSPQLLLSLSFTDIISGAFESR